MTGSGTLCEWLGAKTVVAFYTEFRDTDVLAPPCLGKHIQIETYLFTVFQAI